MDFSDQKKLGPILNAIKSGQTYDEIAKAFRVGNSFIGALRDRYPLFAGPTFMERIAKYRVKNGHSVKSP